MRQLTTTEYLYIQNHISKENSKEIVRNLENTYSNWVTDEMKYNGADFFSLIMFSQVANKHENVT